MIRKNLLRTIDSKLQNLFGLPYLAITRDSTIFERTRFVADVVKKNKELTLPFHVLDVGCGSGINLPTISQTNFCKKYTGIDLKVNVDFYKERYSYVKNVDFCFKNVNLDEDFKFDDVDLVICMEVLEHLDQDKALVGRIANNLRDGGIVILTMPSLSFIRKIGKELPWMLDLSEIQDGGHVRHGYDRAGIENLIDGFDLELVSVSAISPYDSKRAKISYKGSAISRVIQNIRLSVSKLNHTFISKREDDDLLDSHLSIGVVLRKKSKAESA